MKRFTRELMAFAKNLRAELKKRSRDAVAIGLAFVITMVFACDVRAQDETVSEIEELVTVFASDQINLDPPEVMAATLGTQSNPNKISEINTTKTTIRTAALVTNTAVPAKPEPEPEPVVTTTTRLARVYPTTTRATTDTRYTGRFASGYCTDYVDRNVDWVNWRGHAKDWDTNAAAAGHKVGLDQALPGNIIVTRESSYGHVAVIDQVKADGTLVISEWNYKGLYNKTVREISPNDPKIKNFIGK
jgi:surface antigen